MYVAPAPAVTPSLVVVLDSSEDVAWFRVEKDEPQTDGVHVSVDVVEDLQAQTPTKAWLVTISPRTTGGRTLSSGHHHFISSPTRKATKANTTTDMTMAKATRSQPTLSPLRCAGGCVLTVDDNLLTAGKPGRDCRAEVEAPRCRRWTAGASG